MENRTFWSDIMKKCLFCEEIGDLEGKKAEILPILQGVADTQRAILHRISNKEAKNHYKKRKNPHSNVKNHALFIHIAEYYEGYYSNGKKLENPIRPELHPDCEYHDHCRTERTKNKNYRHKRYDSFISELWSDFVSKGGNTDEEFMLFIYQKSPKYAFSEEELRIFSDIYRFATSDVIEFSAKQRSNRRKTTYMTCTFLEFAEWYRDDFELYSSSDRFFVPLFVKHYPDYSATQIDGLLRYDYEEECFSRNDYKYLINVVGESFDIDKFFYVLEVIRKMSKKKQP